VLRYQGDLDGALKAIREAHTIVDQGSYRNPTIRMIDRYGVFLREGLILGEDGGINLNRPAEAVDVLQKAVDSIEEFARKDPRDALSRGRVGTSTRELGNILRWRDPRRALAVYDLGIQRLGEIRNNLKAHRDRAVTLANSSYALRRLHRNAEARERIAAAIAILRETKDYSAERVRLESEVYSVQSALRDDLAETGSPKEGLPVYEDLHRESWPLMRTHSPTCATRQGSREYTRALLRSIAEPENALLLKAWIPAVWSCGALGTKNFRTTNSCSVGYQYVSVDG